MEQLPPVVWNSLVDHSLEICWIAVDGPVWTFEATATLVEGDVPFALSYVLRLNRQTGQTRFDAKVRSGTSQERSVRVTGSPSTAWQIGGGDDSLAKSLPSGACIDLGWTPLTNTYSIWRLDLAVGQSSEIVNAWVPFPEFVLRPSIQRYTRLSQRRYRYEQPEIDFAAELDLDEHGLVRRYGDIWEALPHPELR